MRKKDFALKDLAVVLIMDFFAPKHVQMVNTAGIFIVAAVAREAATPSHALASRQTESVTLTSAPPVGHAPTHQINLQPLKPAAMTTLE